MSQQELQATSLDLLEIVENQLEDGEPIIVKETLMRLMMMGTCLLYTSPSPRDQRGSRMPSSA